MITYLYWMLVFGLVIAVMAVLGAKLENMKAALVSAAVVLFIGWAVYFFYLQQIFVKRWGGVMSISVPDGQYHIATTWKEDNLWVENYDPETDKCIFSEYSKGNLLQGRVTIKNCRPLALNDRSAGQSRNVEASPHQSGEAP
ncbi:MAG: hypothetical protein PVI91_01520 [Gammaproteobacteria bacterium]